MSKTGDTSAVVDALREIGTEEPPALELAEYLAEETDSEIAEAQDRVYDAVDRGLLTEAGDGFGGLRLAADHAADATEPVAEAGSDPEKGGVSASETTKTDPEKSAESADSGVSDGDKYRRIYLDAADRADRETWEYVEEAAIRDALSEAGFAELLDNGTLFDISGWKVADLSDTDEEPQRRWYYASGDEPRPAEFRRFDKLLTDSAPDDYTPHYFRVTPAGKDPATEFGSWKTDEARLTVEEAVGWMESGGNVGIAGCGPCEGCEGRQSEYCPVCEGEKIEDALVNVDIDDDEETTPEDVPTSLRARSRSRTGWHTWYFDENDEIPNIPTDQYGEVRTNWQYVVAPGSFVASTADAIPGEADNAGYYTVEETEPVVSLEYDQLPDVFHEKAEEVRQAEREAVEAAVNEATQSFDESLEVERSAVFDIDATDIVTSKDSSDRFTSIFHGSDTHSNMNVKWDLLHCWRHEVAHGGLQTLAVLSNVDHVSSFGCEQIGAPKKHSKAGPNRLKGDWRLVWGAWHEAKRRGLIPTTDPIPYNVLTELAVADGLVEREDLVEREADTGEIVDSDPETETYTALPPGTYDDALDHVTEEYNVDPGRETTTQTRSDYLEVDLAEFLGDGDDRDPYSDPEAMLRACLRARDAGQVDAETTPPTLALLPLQRDLLGIDADRNMSDGTKDRLVKTYHGLTEADLDAILG